MSFLNALFGPSPEEQQRREMQATDSDNKMQEILESADGETLVLLRRMVHASAEESNIGYYFVGRMDAVLKRKGLCFQCGRDHIADSIGDDHQPVEKPDVSPEPEREYRESPIVDQDPREVAKEVADEWGVEFVDPEMTGYSMPVRCKQCGTRSVSLDDRRVKPPGSAGCPGCLQKTKWG